VRNSTARSCAQIISLHQTTVADSLLPHPLPTTQSRVSGRAWHACTPKNKPGAHSTPWPMHNCAVPLRLVVGPHCERGKLARRHHLSTVAFLPRDPARPPTSFTACFASTADLRLVLCPTMRFPFARSPGPVKRHRSSQSTPQQPANPTIAF